MACNFGNRRQIFMSTSIIIERWLCKIMTGSAYLKFGPVVLIERVVQLTTVEFVVDLGNGLRGERTTVICFVQKLHIPIKTCRTEVQSCFVRVR
jgi:hypothetical protein